MVSTLASVCGSHTARYSSGRMSCSTEKLTSERGEWLSSLTFKGLIICNVPAPNGLGLLAHHLAVQPLYCQLPDVSESKTTRHSPARNLPWLPSAAYDLKPRVPEDVWSLPPLPPLSPDITASALPSDVALPNSTPRSRLCAWLSPPHRVPFPVCPRRTPAHPSLTQ